MVADESVAAESVVVAESVADEHEVVVAESVAEIIISSIPKIIPASSSRPVSCVPIATKKGDFARARLKRAGFHIRASAGPAPPAHPPPAKLIKRSIARSMS